MGLRSKHYLAEMLVTASYSLASVCSALMRNSLQGSQGKIKTLVNASLLPLHVLLCNVPKVGQSNPVVTK